MSISIPHLAACLLVLALAGCAKVAPFERGTLAHRCMVVTTTPERQAARDHVLSVREAAAGAQGARGGGCGCN